jgi:EAL domain-containing protein (putative c-di-GMP-specific phosphodiesterase class I)
MALKADLRRAVAGGEFLAHYQPIVDLATGEIIGAEALARWHSPKGILAPAAFLGLAEETGLIADIGWSILDQACAAAAGWIETFGDRAPMNVSVNLSHRQMIEGELVDRVRQSLRASGLPAPRLTLEVTETVLLDDTDVIAAQLARLKGLGVQVALDDFGTGYSSLSHLDRFPVDIVKIDKSFIDSLALGEVASPLVGAIINLGAVLGMRVTAEGIEDADQLAALRALGCARGQGYYFAKPVTESQIRRLVAAQGQPVDR